MEQGSGVVLHSVCLTKNQTNYLINFIAETLSITAMPTHNDFINTLSMPHLTSMAWDYKDQLDEVDLGGAEHFIISTMPEGREYARW